VIRNMLNRKHSLQRLLSGDYPRSKVLAVHSRGHPAGPGVRAVLFPGVKALNVAAKVLVFVVLVASFDLLLGYTGIVSFAHTMFFGIGAYGIAMATTRMGPTWAALGVGIGGALLLSLLLSLAVGLFSLRVRAIFFAMITLAVAAAFQTLASQLSDITGGEDGLTFKVPELLIAELRALRDPFAGRAHRRQADHLLPAVRHGRGAGAGAAAHRQFALWPCAAGHPRERVPRRGHRLPRGGVPHHIERAVGTVCHAGGCHAGALAALQRAGHLAEL
jgi:hypothetical protein